MTPNPHLPSRVAQEIFLGTKLNLLLPCIPLAMISDAMGPKGWGDGWTFTYAQAPLKPTAPNR